MNLTVPEIRESLPGMSKDEIASHIERLERLAGQAEAAKDETSAKVLRECVEDLKVASPSTTFDDFSKEGVGPETGVDRFVKEVDELIGPAQLAVAPFAEADTPTAATTGIAQPTVVAEAPADEPKAGPYDVEASGSDIPSGTEEPEPVPLKTIATSQAIRLAKDKDIDLREMDQPRGRKINKDDVRQYIFDELQ